MLWQTCLSSLPDKTVEFSSYEADLHQRYLIYFLPLEINRDKSLPNVLNNEIK